MVNPNCGKCGMLNHAGFCMLTACRFPQVNTDLGFMPPPKRTNADRIRSMTDEELAYFIAYSTPCETCIVKKGGSDECRNTTCPKAWLDWLRQESEA